MTTIEFDKNIGKLVIKSDDITTKVLLEFRRKITKYCVWTKSWRTEEVLEKLYDNPRRIGPKNGVWTFEVKRGWAAYLASIFKDRMDQGSYQNILNCIMSPTYRTIPFPEMRDYQNTDILHILKYNFGLASLNTSYGKTSCICILAHYFYEELGKPTLIVVPQTKPRDEIVKRYKMMYGVDLPLTWEEGIGCVSVQGILNRKVMKDPKTKEQEAQKLLKYEISMFDECEYCINPGGKWILDNLLNVEKLYGFSGSADKIGGSCLSFASGITSSIMDNKDLISYFGPALVHRMPVSNKFNNITIKSESLNKLDFTDEEIDEDSNIYLEILKRMWTDPNILDTIDNVIRAYPKLYIPINNIESIISTWVERWKGKFRILVICGEGYLYYDKNGDMTNLSLEEAVEKMRAEEVDVIPSTASGFRALDFPGLSNMLMVAGKIAGVILQTVGRTARSEVMNIISLAPKKFKWIPVYTKGMKERDKLLQEYYKFCQITNITLNEEDLIPKI